MDNKIINESIIQHIEVAKKLFDLEDVIFKVAKLSIQTIKNNGKILLFGNGGSASDAQHIAAELVGRYNKNRVSLPAIALTTDSSAITCIANDFGYESLFSRQIESLCSANDLVIGISTGGTSLNVINGLLSGKEKGCKTVGFSGKGGGEFNKICDINIVVPSSSTARVQEMHILIGHMICEAIDNEYTTTQTWVKNPSYFFTYLSGLLSLPTNFF